MKISFAAALILSAAQAGATDLVTMTNERDALRAENAVLRGRLEDLLPRAYDMRAVSMCYLLSNARFNGIMHHTFNKPLSNLEIGALDQMKDVLPAANAMSPEDARNHLFEVSRSMLGECLRKAKYEPAWTQSAQD